MGLFNEYSENDLFLSRAKQLPRQRKRIARPLSDDRSLEFLNHTDTPIIDTYHKPPLTKKEAERKPRTPKPVKTPSFSDLFFCNRKKVRFTHPERKASAVKTMKLSVDAVNKLSHLGKSATSLQSWREVGPVDCVRTNHTFTLS